MGSVLCGHRERDGLVGFEQRLVLGEHLADRRFGPVGQRPGPDLGRRAADVLGLVDPPPPGQGLVHPAEPQVRTEEGERDRGFPQQRGQQGGVGHVHP
jgi:hypothetical protein